MRERKKEKEKENERKRKREIPWSDISAAAAAE